MPRQASEIGTDGPGTLRSLWRSTVTRRVAQRGQTPSGFRYIPDGLHIGDPVRGDALIRGQFSFDGTSAKAERGDPWRIEPPSRRWAQALHGFLWLEDLRAVDGQAARKAARKMTDAWLHRYARKGGTPWRAAVLGDRVVSWCLNARLLTEDAEPVYSSDLFRSLAAQARYAAAALQDEPLALDRLRVALAPAYSALCIEGEQAGLKTAIGRVVRAIDETINFDGGPRSRNPSELFRCLSEAVRLRRALIDADESAFADTLADSIDRMTPVLRLLRLGDGELMLLHGGRAEKSERIDRVLAEARVSAPAELEAPDSGVVRLAAGATVALMDAGATPPAVFAARSHSAPLAIEFSSLRQRIFVNCGSAVHLSSDWESACRLSAAHSTLTLDENAPGSFDGKNAAPGRRLSAGAEPTERKTDSDASGIWALGGHDGYAERFGLVHYRRLFLSSDGKDFRGEDTLALTKNGSRILEKARAERKSPAGPAFAIRFHLHPDVQVELVEGKADLTLPGGEVWRLIQSGGALKLEDSLYIPQAANPLPTRQIVIDGALADREAKVRWAVKLRAL